MAQALELRRRVRTIPPIGAVLFLASGLLLAVRHPDSAIEIVAVNTLAAVVVLAIRPLVPHASLRGVIGLSLLLPTVAGATVIALIALEPGTFANGLASLAIVPIATPLLLAWDAADESSLGGGLRPRGRLPCAADRLRFALLGPAT